ncbi:MAG: Tfx family DNA-binding protein [Desulfurococcaceae archaeon]
MGWKQYGFLTERQYAVLSYRVKGYTQSEVAERLGISRSAVASIEKSAKRKIELAQKTISLYRQMLSVAILKIKAGTKLIDIPSIVIRRADELGIKLKGDFSYIYSQLRYGVGVRKPVLDREVLVLFFKDGSFEITSEDLSKRA